MYYIIFNGFQRFWKGGQILANAVLNDVWIYAGRANFQTESFQFVNVVKSEVFLKQLFATGYTVIHLDLEGSPLYKS